MAIKIYVCRLIVIKLVFLGFQFITDVLAGCDCSGSICNADCHLIVQNKSCGEQKFCTVFAFQFIYRVFFSFWMTLILNFSASLKHTW
jgi:hypothetical protein